METLLNLTTPGQRIASHLDSDTYARRDHDDEVTDGGIGKMTTANFVLMFGILALVLLTIRAILMKTGSTKCRRKRRNENPGDAQEDSVNSAGPPVSRRTSHTTSDCSDQSSRRFNHITEHSIFMLSPPSYDSNHQYPAAAPPPYTPGDPAPIFADRQHPLSKTLVRDATMSPPPYETLPNMYKPFNNSNIQSEHLQRQKSDVSQSTETTQL